jgi:hypothetical protein
MEQNKTMTTQTTDDEGPDAAANGGEALSDPAVPANADDRLAAIEGRVAALEAQLAGGKVKQRRAPVTGSEVDRRAAKRARRQAG